MVRVTGNDAVYPSSRDRNYFSEHAKELFTLVNEVTEKTFDQPKRRDARHAALPESAHGHIA